MNIDKVSSRAKRIAEELGVEFKVPDIKSAQERAQRKIHKMKEYTTKKDQYDAAVAHIIETYSKDDILAFIAANGVLQKP